jgi:very-short-patch-repair endonuclease
MPDARTIDPNICSRSTTRALDRLIADLATRQHGVVSRAQLLLAGFTRRTLDHRVAMRRLHVVHLGVYAVGHRCLSTDGRWMAATLAAGPGAVLSHRAAAGAWCLLSSDYLEVTGPSRRTRPGIRIHRSQLPPDEVTTVREIPVTGLSRTLLDLASVLPRERVERAAKEAEVQGLRDSLSLDDLVARYPRRHGVRTIKAILEQLQSGTILTRSELESRFLAFVRKTGLPSPALNAQLLGFECDCPWREQRVIAELDGHTTHRTRAAFEDDRVRDRTLTANGWRTVRITWRQLQRDPDALAIDLTRILAEGTRDADAFAPGASREKMRAS